MNKDDIMKLALESGFAKILDEHASEYRNFTFELSQDQYPELGRFIDLVAAHKAEVALAEAYRCGHEAAADELRRLHEVNQELLEALKAALEQPVQEPKKRCCDHDSDCAIHNGDALPVGPCDCSQTFISSPDLGIVVTVSYQLAVRELAKLVAENFGQMPRNDKWADKVLLVRDTFEAAHNKGAKP